MTDPAETNEEPRRLICHGCGQRFWLKAGEPRTCAECGGYLRHFGPLEGMVDRFFAPPDMVDSQLHRRHLQMVEALWTQGNRGREYFDIVQPRVSYSRFVRQVTDLVCRGMEEGWIELVLPPAPVPDDRAYQLIFHEPDRFANEMSMLFTAKRRR